LVLCGVSGHKAAPHAGFLHQRLSFNNTDTNFNTNFNNTASVPSGWCLCVAGGGGGGGERAPAVGQVAQGAEAPEINAACFV
jgi:hypothetical protein